VLDGAAVKSAAQIDKLAALGKKVEARMPGVGKILREMRDSGDPDRIADCAYLTGTLRDITAYVDLLKELSGLFEVKA
jgi:hypothetical protein